MTTTDKTRQKLVDSMRKTRAASVASPPVKNKGTIKKNTRTTKKRSRPDSESNMASQARSPARNSGGRTSMMSDTYQYGRRVWPD